MSWNPLAYQLGHMHVSEERLGWSPLEAHNPEIAQAIIKAEQQHDYALADRIIGISRILQPPEHYTQSEKEGWWLAYYAGRHAARRGDLMP